MPQKGARDQQFQKKTIDDLIHKIGLITKFKNK